MKQPFIVLTTICAITTLIVLIVLIFNPSKEYLVALDYKYVEDNSCYIIVKRADNGKYERIRVTASQYQDIDDYQMLYTISTRGLEQKVLYTYDLQIFE